MRPNLAETEEPEKERRRKTRGLEIPIQWTGKGIDSTYTPKGKEHSTADLLKEQAIEEARP